MAKKRCKRCGEEFIAHASSQKYCDKCRGELGLKVAKICIECGMRFETVCTSKLDTCPVCRNKPPRNVPEYDEAMIKHCKHCGKKFKEREIRIDEYGIHPAGVDYCCIQCMEAEEY